MMLSLKYGRETGQIIGRQPCIHVYAWWIEVPIVDSRQGIVLHRQIRQASGLQPFLVNLFQDDRIFVIQTSGDAVEDEDRQQAKGILKSAHDDSFK